MKTIAVTGANGFIGRALTEELERRGVNVRRLTRDTVGTISGETDWCRAVEGCDAVFHTAAAVHQPRGDARSSTKRYATVNVDGTRRLAEQAAALGVRRLVFLSTVKVNGDRTGGKGDPDAFSHDNEPNPLDEYARSKLEAEIQLRRLGKESSLETTIVRPPLVYGPGVKANFAALIRAVRVGLPLPLASVDNRRSLVAIDNLVDFLALCVDHPRASNETLMVSDGEDISTPDLVERIARALGVKARLFPCPVNLLVASATLVGRMEQVRRLTESLRVDIDYSRQLLGWKPIVSVDLALKRTMDAQG